MSSNQPKTNIPVLLLPLNIETRFMDRQLWVRIYPDDIMLDRHEPQLSPAELEAGQRYHTAGQVVGVVRMRSNSQFFTDDFYFATGEGRLWKKNWIRGSHSSLPSELLGNAKKVVAMTVLNSQLYCATADNQLWVCEPFNPSIEWKRIGNVNQAVGLAAVGNQLYCATADDRLLIRKAVLDDVDWQLIGQIEQVTAMTAMGGSLYCLTKDNKLWTREAVPDDVDWRFRGQALVGSVSAMGPLLDGMLYTVSKTGLVCRLEEERDNSWGSAWGSAWGSGNYVRERYWRPRPLFNLNSSTNYRDAWRDLAQQFGSSRAAWIIHKTRQQSDIPVSDLNQDSLIKPAKIFGLPDQFEVFVYRDDRLVYQKLGQPISQTKFLTLHAPLPLGLQARNHHPSLNEETSSQFSDLYDEHSRWTIDFEEAVSQGMAVKINLGSEDWDSNACFSKIVVVGLRTNTTNDVSLLGEVEQLLNHHHYTNGFAFLSQDTPTNNTEISKSGFSGVEDHDHTFDIEISDIPGWNQARSKAQQLSQALGLPPSIFRHVSLAGDRTATYAGDLNKALWPATGDYFLRYMLSNISTGISLLRKDQLAKVDQHFSDFVRADGPLPAIRVHDQPYGVLPVTRFGKQTAGQTTVWRSSTLDHTERPDEWIKFNDELHNVLMRLMESWLDWATNPTLVPRVRENSEDPHQDLLKILAMEPVSTSHWTRPFVDERFVAWCLANLGQYAFPKQVFPGSPLGWMYQWDKTWRNLRHATATLISCFIGVPENHPDFNSMVFKFDNTPLLRILGWGQGQPLLIPLLENPESDVQRSFVESLRELCQKSIQDHPDVLLRDMLQRALTLAKSNGMDVESRYEAICDLANAPISKPTLDRLFRESLDLCTHRLDAWITSLATQRLEAMRRRCPKGTYLGAYGWVENLRRAEVKTSAGYIHTPSAGQSATAAVLYNAYLAHQSQTNGQGEATDINPYHINLTSTRVQQSLKLMEGVRQGQPLGTLLGLQFERMLYDYRLSHYIDDFRAAFPIVATKETDPYGGEAVEAIAARTVVDGLTLVRWWSQGAPAFEDRPEGLSLGDADSVRNVKQALADGHQPLVLKAVEDLTDALDGISDVLMHEAVYQTVQGNFDRGGAVLEAASGNASPPEIESMRTQTSETSYGNRVLLLFCKDVSALSTFLPQMESVGPRGRAEPTLHTWISDLLGDLRQIGCHVEFNAANRIDINRASVADLRDVRELNHRTAIQLVNYRQQHGPFTMDHLGHLSGLIHEITGHYLSDRDLESLRRKITIRPITLCLAHLTIDALDLLYMAATPPTGEATELEQRIAFCVRSTFGLSHDQPIKINLDSCQGLSHSIKNALELLENILHSIGGKSYAHPAFFTLPELAENATSSEPHISELRARVETTHQQLETLVQKLKGIDNFIPEVLLEAAQFGVSGTIPTALDDPLIEELRQSTIQIFEQRAAQCQDLLKKANAALIQDPGIVQPFDTNQAISHLVAAMQALFGESFIVMPLFEPHRREALGMAIDTQVAHGLAPERIRLWLEQAAYTRAALAGLETILSYTDAWSHTGAATLTPLVAQLLPEGASALENSRWLALDDQERVTPEVEGIPIRPQGALSLAMFTPSQGALSMSRLTHGEARHILQEPICFAGLLIDAWNESIPNETVDTSVAFQYNQPNAQAPQCLLLAVPSEHKAEPELWTREALKDILLDTMDLYKIRAVDPDAMRGVGAIFPALFLPTDPEKPDWAREVFKETIEGWFSKLLRRDKGFDMWKSDSESCLLPTTNRDFTHIYTSVGRDFTHSESGIRFLELPFTSSTTELHIGGEIEAIRINPTIWGVRGFLLTLGSEGIRVVLPDFTPKVGIVAGWRDPNQCDRSSIVVRDHTGKSLACEFKFISGVRARKIRYREGEEEYEYFRQTYHIFAPAIKFVDVYGSCGVRVIQTFK